MFERLKGLHSFEGFRDFVRYLDELRKCELAIENDQHVDAAKRIMEWLDLDTVIEKLKELGV